MSSISINNETISEMLSFAQMVGTHDAWMAKLRISRWYQVLIHKEKTNLTLNAPNNTKSILIKNG